DAKVRRLILFYETAAMRSDLNYRPPRSAESANSCVILSSSRNTVSFSSLRPTNRFPSPRCASATKIGAALGIVDHLRRRFARFKLGAHFLDLGGLLLELGCESLSLLSELSCESLYLFLLLRGRCLQLLNFVIEHGLVLGLGTAARLRSVTMRRSRC